MFERVIIASGTSNRQTKALAASVRDSVRHRGMQVLSTEGEDNGEWIIVDCGAAVAHIMQPAIREYYHLEEIWGGKAVRMKVGEVGTKLVKASEPEPQPRRAAAKEPAAKTATAKPAPGAAARPARPVAGKVTAKTAATSTAKSAAKNKGKTAGRTSASTSAKTAPKTAAKTPARKAADKSAAYQRVGARRPTATGPAGKTVVAGKPPARKAAAKTAARKAPRSR